MNKIICSSCGTENEQEYKYCKNCGTELEIVEEEHNVNYGAFNQNVPPQSGEYKVSNKGIITDSISGVSAEEIALFVGKKANDILPKFSKMELSNSKVSWCWPVAVLGYLFGPLGAAFWFFYRKMYKPAALLTLIGCVVTIVTTLLNGGGITFDSEALYEALMSGDINAYLELFSSVPTENVLLTVIANIINNGASILSCILCGLFGFNVYKNHCVERIVEYRAIQADKRYYKLGLASIGGVSGGMAFLGVVIMILVSNLATMLSTLLGVVIGV